MPAVSTSLMLTAESPSSSPVPVEPEGPILQRTVSIANKGPAQCANPTANGSAEDGPIRTIAAVTHAEVTPVTKTRLAVTADPANVVVGD